MNTLNHTTTEPLSIVSGLASIIKFPFALTRDAVTLAEDVIVETVDVLKSVPGAIQDGLTDGMLLKPNSHEYFMEKLAKMPNSTPTLSLPVDTKVLEATLVEQCANATVEDRLTDLLAEVAELQAMLKQPAPIQTGEV